MDIRFDENGFIKPYTAVETNLEMFQTIFTFKYGLDAYFEPVYPETHFMNAVTRYNTADWIQLYRHDRQSRRKGFIQLNF